MTRLPVEIVPAKPGDASAIRACVRAAYEKYVPRMDREPAPMLADYEALIGQRVVNVVRDGRDVCAVIVTMPGDEGWFVENVAVHPSYQGHGLGGRLMAFAESEARAGGFTSLYLYTHEVMTENLAFYEHLGFVESRRTTESGYRRIYLTKVLVSSEG
jgi:GNAT superfamily N-acetyltransferase